MRGDALRFLGQHESALAEYSIAADLFRRLRQPSSAARADACAVDSLRCLGRGADALRLAQRARRVFKGRGEALRSAVLDEIVGLVYFEQNDFARALRQFDRARSVIAAMGRAADLATLNNNAAIALTNLDRLGEAEALYAESRAYYAEQGSDAALARVDMNLGYLAFRQGRYGAAVDLLRGAADAYERVGNLPLTVSTRLDLADTYLALNLLDEAGQLSEQQLRAAEAARLPNDRARALFLLSAQKGRLGRVGEALPQLAEAEAEFAALGDGLWKARCRLARAGLLLASGDPDHFKHAIAEARSAARVFGRLGLPSRQALANAMHARALLEMGRVRAAEAEARSGLELALEVGVPWLLFECQYVLGRALSAGGLNDSAYSAYRDAADALERVRSELQPEELRVSLVADKTDLYQRLVALCLDRSDVSEALQHAERAKSRAFAELLTGAVEPTGLPAVSDGIGTSDALTVKRLRELRAELVWLYSRLGEAPESPAAKPMRSRVASREAELVRLRRRLQPATRQGQPRSASEDAIASIEKLRRLLEPQTAVIEYFQAGYELVAFVIGAAGPTAYRLGRMEEIADLVDRFRFQVGKFGLGEDYVRDHGDALLATANDLLGELYSRLIGPLADELRGRQQLIVVPHGVLHYLPFHALIDPGGAALVERLEVSYAPSANVLARCYARPTPRAGSRCGLVIGVTEPGLPRISEEVAAVAPLVGAAEPLVGGEATEQAFRGRAPEADLIHLASHAVFRADNPLFSAIKLADSWISLYDLYGLRLRASLVVLSACETGVNQVVGGDELVGLARGFFHAGAATVVVSLWAVNDESTAQLMRRFYSHLTLGLGPAAAMRNAQTEMRADYPHPYHWAPFVVIGRP